MISQNILREGGKKISGKSLVFDQTPLGPPPRTYLQYHHLMSHFARQIWAYIRGRFGHTYAADLDLPVPQTEVRIHPSVHLSSCAICRIEAPFEKHLRMHIQAKHDDRVLTCEKCEKKCIGGIKLKTHKEVTCNHCKKRIPYNSRNSHMAKCVSEEFKCENCRAVFNRADGLKRHVDKNRCEIQCNLFDKTLKSTEYLEKHNESTHRVQMNVVKTKEGHIGLFQSTELQNNLKCTRCDFVATYHNSWLAKKVVVTLVTLIWLSPVCCRCVTSNH